jgi:hypothetical protein
MSLAKRHALVTGSTSDATEIPGANFSIDGGWTAA